MSLSTEQIVMLQESDRLNRECGRAVEAFSKTIYELKVLFEELPAKLVEVV